MATISKFIDNNIPAYSVSEIAGAIEKLVNNSFDFVKIKGEVSQIVKRKHIYFSLKDSGAMIKAVAFSQSIKGLSYIPEEGDEVCCYGRVSTYKAQSQYQLIVTDIRIEGRGALLALLEKRKEKFLKEGLFAQNLKKDIPRFVQNIFVVTSETGAVIHDIIHRIQARFPCHIILYPVTVQGKNSEIEISKAITNLNLLYKDKQNLSIVKPDVIIVARGGGSIEDLWSFNEEIVVRAVFNSEIPIISAIGHETDFTLIDYVSDVRAPTPTAAAEIATPEKENISSYLNFRLTAFQDKIKSIIEKKQSQTQILIEIINKDIGLITHLLNKVNMCNDRIDKKINLAISQRLYSLNQLEIIIHTPINIIYKKIDNLHRLQIILQNAYFNGISLHRNKLSEHKNKLNISNYVIDKHQYKVVLNKNQIGKLYNLSINNIIVKLSNLSKKSNQFYNLENLLSEINNKRNNLLLQQKKITKILYAHLKVKQSYLLLLLSKIDINNYQKILEKGYAIIKNKEGKVISSVEEVVDSKEIKVQLYDGSVDAKVKDLLDFY